MPESKEVFDMVTQKAGPDQGALQRQHEAQERRRRRQRIGAIGVAAAVIAALAVLFLTNPTTGSDEGAADEGTTPSSPVAPMATATMDPAFVGLDGKVIKGVTLPPDAWEPTLSSDGTWIAYVTRSTDVGFCGGCTPGPRIAAVRTDGTRSHFVTMHIGVVEQPAWSPDGTRIAFAALRAGDLGNIFVVDADGTNLQRLTSGSTQKGWPSWSPDGTHIIYNDAGSIPLDSDGYSNTQEIYSVAADGSAAPVQVTANHFNDSEAVYSPDGSRIALFQGGPVVIMDADGTHARRVADEGFSPRWSPDGTKIAFLVYNPDERYALFDPRSGAVGDFPRLDVKVLTVGTGDVSDLGMSVATDLNAVSWTPDSQSLFVNRASNPA